MRTGYRRPEILSREGGGIVSVIRIRYPDGSVGYHQVDDLNEDYWRREYAQEDCVVTDDDRDNDE